jgi:mono/diheme cytochrome c family protein
MNFKPIASIAFLLLAVVGWFRSPGLPTIEAASDAASTYRTQCASCHAADGSGATAVGKQLKVPDLRSPAIQKLSNQRLAASIANGKGSMPAFGKTLASKEIDLLVNHVRTMRKG